MKENNNYLLVDNHQKLQTVLDALDHKKQIAIDTEFVRVSTLHPIVALIQLNDGENTYLVDPIVLPPQDLNIFWEHLINSDALMIFFSMHEDLDLIHFYTERLPKNIVDLQWMASFLGEKSKKGLAATLEHFLDVEILKDQTTSVWMQRPLTNDQLRYGAVDVIYLIELYELLKEKIEALGNFDYFMQDMALFRKTAIKPYDRKLCYLRYANSSMTRHELAKLRDLLNYRQDQAEEANVCLKFVFPDRLIIPLATKSIRSMQSLERLGLHWKSIRDYGKDLLRIVTQKPDTFDYDQIIDHGFSSPADSHEIVEQAKDLIRKFSEEHHIEQTVVGSAKKIHEVLVYLNTNSEERKYLEFPLMLDSKWRLDLVRDLLLGLFPNEPLLQK